MGIADSLQLPSSKQGAIIDSGALLHFCPDKPKFINFKPLKGKIICTANDSVLYIHGIEKVAIELPNGSGKMKCILKETIYSPEMAFTLISAFCLDKAGCLTIFAKSQYCQIGVERSDYLGDKISVGVARPSHAFRAISTM